MRICSYCTKDDNFARYFVRWVATGERRAWCGYCHLNGEPGVDYTVEEINFSE